MIKTLNTFILFSLGQSVIAQKGIENLLLAEKDFAAYSVAHSTKEAFQKFIDSNSIMFDNGKPVNAIEFWEKREKNAGVLNWRPQYAEISASGDFGYTTGPWTFQSTKNDTIAARGQYTTVWHINKNGEWKFLVDLGIDNEQPGSTEERIIDTPKEPAVPDEHSPINLLERAETNFNSLQVKNNSKAYETWLSHESILTRHGFLPAATSAERRSVIVSTPAGIKYTMDGFGISIIPDMGYTYGKSITGGKTENYLRIWRREKNGWRIAVEVLRY